ncbi:MAG: response regulator [Thermodesulfobacteriota bacterium]|nr:MAG: response regulator [Thermodesulfobacteriota bacterium]
MPPKRVLIADDTEFFRAALKDILSRAGYEVVGEASNGAEAIELASTLRPDLVILDVVMPAKNGIEAARAISALNLPLKIVMCTSLGYEPIVEEAVKAGASGYIIKPPSESKVLAALKAL